MRHPRIALRFLSVFLAVSAIACGGTIEDTEPGDMSVEQRQAYTLKKYLEQLPPGTVSEEWGLPVKCSEIPDRCCTGTYCCTWIGPGLPPQCG